MATVAHVLTELAQLSNEARRKNGDVRQAIENAHVLAKTLPATTELAQSEDAQSVLCAPFLLALNSGSSKLVLVALPLLLRLASSTSLSPKDLASVIESLYKLDATSHPVETQLKMLQVLPALALNYALEHELFVRLLAVTCRLASSGNVVVSNTASATLQQVISSLFESTKRDFSLLEAPASEVTLETDAVAGKTVTFTFSSLDLRRYQLISDLSHAFSGQKLDFFADKDIRIRPEAALEILENVLALNRDLFETRREFTDVFKHKTVPGLLQVLNSASPQYALIVRTLRIVVLVFSYDMGGISEEKELFLASTNHILLDEPFGQPASTLGNASSAPGHPYWEKALVAESYKALLSDFGVVRRLFETFDAHEQKKKSVLREMLVVMNSYLATGHADLFASKSVQAYPERSGGTVLSKALATLKTPMMDHLDRQEPPTHVPELYAPFLVLKSVLGFADGVSKFVVGISGNANAETLEADVDFVTSLNESVFATVLPLFRRYLYCACDQECFHMTVRALQKYTHSVGLLGLSDARDQLLVMLAESIVYSGAAEDEKKAVSSNSSNLLALGESLVESLSTSTFASAVSGKSEPMPTDESAETKPGAENKVNISNNPNNPNNPNNLKRPIPRSFNSRQVVCLRAFSNLAVSLGSTLQHSWKLVWTTLQWVEYFLEGADDVGNLLQQKDSRMLGELRLTGQDLAGIHTSQVKLMESLSGCQYEAFSEAFLALLELYNQETDGKTPLDSSAKATPKPCPFNRSYFVKMILTLSTLDIRQFSFIESELWQDTSVFFETLATNRTLAHHKRTQIVERYTGIINNITRKGFKQNTNVEMFAVKSLDALYALVEKMLALGRPPELLMVSSEAEMHLTVLQTLHGLIDDYDRFYQTSWDLVFQILRTAFAHSKHQAGEGTRVAEKITMLISSSFASLKMILDEFLATLPFNQLKSLIDTLVQFCSQKYDLNISFSAVSYFWLISDCIHSNMSRLGETVDASLASIENMAGLESLLQSATATNGSSGLYQALNIYLLSKLSRLSTDDRNQVREGAIQTLFQILDVQENDPQLWELIYHIVFPNLLDPGGAELQAELQAQSETHARKDAMASLNLVLSGLVSVFSKFMMDFEANDLRHHEKFWRRFVEYLGDMLKLRWNDLNLKVFQAYQDVLLSLRNAQLPVPRFVSVLLFDFWVSVPIDYDFVKPEYQESLALFNELFRDVYTLMKGEFGLRETNQVLSVLNKCARYPVLKPGTSDAAKPSRLQKIVVDNLNVIGGYESDKDESDGNHQNVQNVQNHQNHQNLSLDVRAAVVQQLAQISAYPYEVRRRIEAKLKTKFDGKLKIPTFVAVAQYAFERLGPKLDDIENLNVLLKENRLQRIMGDLLDIVRHKAAGVAAEKPKDAMGETIAQPGSDALWVRCNSLILHIVSRLVRENLADFNADLAVWKVLLECVSVTFEQSRDRDQDLDQDQDRGRDETGLVHQYHALSQVVLPRFFESTHHDLVLDFVHQIYANSYLYQANAMEAEMLKQPDAYRALTLYNFDEAFGTTGEIKAEPNRGIRINCLRELFRIAAGEGKSAQIARDFAAIRGAFSLRRFVAAERIVGRKPLPLIQENEISVILEQLALVAHTFDRECVLGLMRLVTQALVYADKVEGMTEAMQKVLQTCILQTR